MHSVNNILLKIIRDTSRLCGIPLKKIPVWNKDIQEIHRSGIENKTIYKIDKGEKGLKDRYLDL